MLILRSKKWKKVQDSAIGPGDHWVAPTEEDFRSSETSNRILRILFEPVRAHFMQKGISSRISLCMKKARDGTRTRGLDLGKVALHQLSHSRISYFVVLLLNTRHNIQDKLVSVNAFSTKN